MGFRFLWIVLSGLLLSFCSPKTKVTKVEQSITRFEKGSAEDAAIADLIKPYKIPLDAEMNKVLIISEQELVKNLPEGVLGNCVADIVLKKSNQYYKGKVDICLLNNGGLRSSLPKGEITLGKVFELMPFENEIVVVTLSGQKMRELFDYIASSKGMPVAGIRMAISDTTAVDIKINGVDFDKGNEYKVATSDYLAAGGDKMKFFKNPLNYEVINHKIRDVLVENMTEEGAKGNTLKAKLDGRIYFQK
jgi:2',3'-cyclic-nucleotide 2'-phosphodiesterase (5'-nucleotidase family)